MKKNQNTDKVHSYDYPLGQQWHDVRFFNE